MDRTPISSEIAAAFDGMSGQLRIAARFLLDRPREVAWLSMRELARQAKVQPATMSRLARHLGFDGYDSLRKVFVDAVRDAGPDFARRADRQVSNQLLNGEQSLSAQMMAGLARQIERLGDGSGLDDFSAAAETLASARRIYCLGMRSSYPVAWCFHYAVSLVSDQVFLVDAAGATAVDLLRHMSVEDALLAISVHPYTREVVDMVDHSVARGSKVVAITDSRASPLAEQARHLILIDTESPSFLHTMTPAFVAAEILAALVTGRGGHTSLQALERAEHHLRAFATHFDSKTRRRR